jgi:hypothetical protein
MQRHARMSPAERQLQPLLEKDYREDVKAYMYEMQVSEISSDPPSLSRVSDAMLITFPRLTEQDDGQRRAHRSAT